MSMVPELMVANERWPPPPPPRAGNDPGHEAEQEGNLPMPPRHEGPTKYILQDEDDDIAPA